MLGRRLAREARVPANYLSKILLMLGNAGIVSATRGSGGGYRLQRSPDEISLIDVVKLFDGSRARPDCLLGHKSRCSDQDPCPAHNRWKEVRQAYVDFLESTTLGQIARREPPPAQKAS